MKKGLIVAGLVLILIGGGYLLLSFYAVKIIQPQIQKAIRPGITLSEIKVGLNSLSVRGVQYEDPSSKQVFLKVEEIRIYPSLLGFLKGLFEIREVTLNQPYLLYRRSREGAWNGVGIVSVPEEKGKEISGMQAKEAEPTRIKINRLRVQNGILEFEDRKVGEPAPRIKIKDFDLKMEDISYPLVSTRSPLELKGKVEGPTKEGSIETKGWVDLKTMDTDLALKLGKVEVKNFEPYYRKRVTAAVESGDINGEAQIVMKGRRVDVPGRMEVVDLQVREGGTVFWVPAEKVSSQLRKKGNHLKASFRVKGNLDDPRFSFHESFLIQVGLSLAGEMGFPIKITGDAGGSEGLVEGMRSIEELFRKKKEKKK